MRYIEDFTEGENIVGHYLVKTKQTQKSKAGKSYLNLTLSDRTGMINAKVWDLNNLIQAFEERDFIKIEGQVILYQDNLQLRITKIRKSLPGEYEKADYIRATDKDVVTLKAEVARIIGTVENTYLRAILENIFLKDNDVSRAFATHSAGKSLHHGYLSGLIEHTLSVVQICIFLAPRYKYVNRDLLVTAAFLHDIGKVFELSECPENDYTDEGQLIGHIVLGTEFVMKHVEAIQGFPQNLRTLLKHCLLSHHGEYEYGSPKRPKTIEAFILFTADNCDAKIKMFEEALDADKTTGKWTGYNKTLLRNIRKSDAN